ncbi:D-alanyl-D-alanine carboxypeptidase family protein [Texcoconibacillus texcoconensis]|uniref:D-alanyl-D-alanine carboxypeptidase n=1 Tax=Texcoconibacillus texcoconensis TaxID=1095777 RepID=A0A840QNK2_9BACI|nr:D-alanyl-D-alanine carboxypeptidase family protein [Texcoconibacillus texcoconensis]MBB5172955.1 D-alanyl-D-alanine carboxypeptidase [Texcoconibacillus texcoconensis]
MGKKLILMLFVITLTMMSLLTTTQASTTYPGSVSAQGAILMEQESGRVLYDKQAQTPMRIASITKIMTAILAIEHGDLDEKVEVSSNAEGTEGSSLYLRAGEKLKLEELVYGLMLRSGNDAAVAIAEHVGGSVDGFVYMMNEKAEEIGMDKTTFRNPHGLDTHEDHMSTAYDMAKLTRYAMENEDYREVTGTSVYRTDTKRENGFRSFRNKNRLVNGMYKDSTGGKTGYTKRAKRTLVSTAERDDLSLIVVTLNAPSDWNDHMSLFNWAFDTYELLPIVEEGVVDNVDDPFYEDRLEADYNFEYPVTQEELEGISKRINVYTPPQDDEWERNGYPNPIGTIDVMVNGDQVGSVPLRFIEEEEEEESLGWFEKLKRTFLQSIGVK